MSTRTKWSILPVALLTMGTLSMAQSQNQPQAAQGSSSLEAKEAPVYNDIDLDRAAGDPQALIATRGVNDAIDGLSRAFANRNAEALKQIWPSIPDKSYAALGKSLSYFKSVSRNFKPEKIDINGDTATVAGTYAGSFVNGPTALVSSGTFHATLKRLGTRWIVASLVCK